MDLDQKYDLRSIPDPKEYSVIPEGRYHVVVEEVDDVKTSSNNNTYVQFTLRVLSGEYTGAKVFDTLTFTQDALSRFKYVAEHLADADLSNVSVRDVLRALPGKQAIADIKVEKGKINPSTGQPYPDKNKVHFTGYHRPPGFQYLPVGQSSASATPSASAPAQPAVAPAPTAQPTPAAAQPQPSAAPVFGSPAKKPMPF
jgi:hypothetical protein